MFFKKRVGTYITQKIAVESFKAYMPFPLPPNPPLNLAPLYPLLDKAMHIMGELNHVITSVPNISLFIYMHVRKEALLSSQIEGTQSSFSDLILFEHHLKPSVAIQDVEEVSNYVKAIQYGLKQLEHGFPLSLRLMRDMHRVLLKGQRGASKLPGEFRRSQNWIGGSRPGNALFVPPPPDRLMECLDHLEKFLHDEKNQLPLLIKIGLVHVQFETIHPFLDGNGRLGRLLIILMLCHHDLLKAPILYLSLYLKQHRAHYYDLLQEVRIKGSWEKWLSFFLEAIIETTENTLNTIKKMNQLFAKDIKKINSLGRAKHSCLITFAYLQKLPQVSVALIAKELKISAPTARAALHYLEKLKIVKEITSKKRDKIYIYHNYLNLLKEDTEPL